MLSQTAEYGLRAVVYLAGCVDGPTTTQELADVAHVPPDYLSKVLQTLHRIGIVRAQRGKRGGFSLARAAGEITILEVIRAFDGSRRIEECPLHIDEHKTQLCALHSRLDEAMVMVENAFGSTTIAELLVEKPGGVRPLCRIKPAPAPL